MQIIEQAIVPKHPERKSEDGIVVTADFVAVIDGSTSKGQLRCHRDFYLRRRSNGELAMTIISSYIKKMPKDSSCHQFCLGATRTIHARYKKSMLLHLAEHSEDRLTASCVIFSRLRREIWMIGDCQCLVDGQLFDNPKPYESILAKERADIIKASPQPWNHFIDDDTARQAIIPHMLETMRQQNKTYSVIDGFSVAEKYVRIITLGFQPQELVLASDGYPFLCPTLAESEARLEQQRQKDPLNIGPDFIATKACARGNNSFDDRTYIRFQI
jgi:glycerophosphoryl diester phosphodiesterase